MQARGFWFLGGVSDVELEAGLKDLLRLGARTEARVVAHLAEVDARRLHLIGGQSLFEYCQVRLGFSESEAWYRICAARAAAKFPIIFELLERRDVHLTAVALIAKYLTPENHRELLDEVRGKTKRQILELLVGRWSKPSVASNVRKLPVRSGAVAAGPTGSLEPLFTDGYRLQLNVTSAFQHKLELARDLVSHANPSGDLAVVVERALDLLIEAERSRRFGRTKRSRSTRDETERNRRMESRCAESRQMGVKQADARRTEAGQVEAGRANGRTISCLRSGSLARTSYGGRSRARGEVARPDGRESRPAHSQRAFCRRRLRGRAD
jgi:hypothetical protein